MGAGGSCNGNLEENRHVETIEDHKDSINCLSVSDDKYHSLITTGCEDGSLRMYSTNDDLLEPLGELVKDGHTSYVTCVICVYIDDEPWIISGGADSSICKWNPASMECVYTYRGHRSRIARVLCTGDFIVSSSADKTAKVWKFNPGEEDRFLWNKEDKALVTTFEGHKLGIISLIFKVGDPEKPFGGTLEVDLEHVDLLFTGSADSTAKCWDFKSGQMIRTYKGHRGPITCMSMDFDESILYTGSEDTNIRSWNIETGACSKVFSGHRYRVQCIEIVNRLMYTGDDHGFIRCVARSGGDLLKEFQGHLHSITRLKLHDRILYSSSADHTVKAFDASSGKLMYTFKHSDQVSCMTLGIDKLYAGTSDGSLMVWNINGLKGISIKKRPARESNAVPAVIVSDLDVNHVEESPRIEKVDLEFKENALRHNCEQYELVTRGRCIVRRGGNLLLTVDLNQRVDLETSQKLSLFLNFGPRPSVNKGTKATFIISSKISFEESENDWDYRVVQTEGKKVVIEVQIPPNAPVGAWHISLDVLSKNDTDESNRHLKHIDTIVYILFNPWSKKDEVYLEDEEQRQEYVSNDVGTIWIGSSRSPRGREWVFGQYDDAVLPACVILMEKSGLLPEQRGSPVFVSRAISRMVNSNDDKGVLVGNWSGEYADGTSPTNWTGSINILEEYLRKGKPVKYGQCWVFSGVVTTVCRALGIPCRSVTNLNSAHDTDCSLTIDKYFDEDGEKYITNYGNAPSGSGDSIWNFHVWNDVWMARPDLPKGFGGWQAIDATPQERSDNGIFECGPASLYAIRTGQTQHDYEVEFVLAEVNADVVTWQKCETEESGFKKISSNKTLVGSQVLTNGIGEFVIDPYLLQDRHDCTRDYKEREGSKAERLTMEIAAGRSRNARHAYDIPTIVDEDIDFELEDIEKVPIGENFVIVVNLENTSNSIRHVALLLSCSSEYYTGIKSKTIKKSEVAFIMDPGERETLRLPVDYKTYFDKLVEYGMVKIVAIANVKETSQTWIAEDSLQVQKPAIVIKHEDSVMVGTELPVKFSFTNPLDIALENCSLIIDGPGIIRPKTIQISSVPANGEMVSVFKIQPTKPGKRMLIAVFNSVQLVDISGSEKMNVKNS